jgi:uncharacterized damage-inducible protein DinB
MTTTEKPFDKARRKLVDARIQFLGQLAKFSKAELTQIVPGEDWTPIQIAHHLYIADGLFLDELKRVQQEDNPLIDFEEETARQTEAAEPPASLDAVMAGMAARREGLFEFLSQVSDEAWERPFQDKSRGQLKFYQLVNYIPKHEQMHIEQLTKIKAAMQS